MENFEDRYEAGLPYEGELQRLDEVAMTATELVFLANEKLNKLVAKYLKADKITIHWQSGDVSYHKFRYIHQMEEFCWRSKRSAWPYIPEKSKELYGYELEKDLYTALDKGLKVEVSA